MSTAQPHPEEGEGFFVKDGLRPKRYGSERWARRMRFELVDAAKKDFPVQSLCKVLGVSESGYFAWRDRPACRRQLVAFTRALGARSLDDAIRVVGVSPGPVATDRIERLLKERSSGADVMAAFPLSRPATVGEIVDLIVFLASPRAAYTSGVVFTVDGGLSGRHAP